MRSGLTADLRRVLVRAQPAPARVPEPAFRGPLAVLDLAGRDGPHEVRQRRLGRAERSRERARLPGQRLQPADEVTARLLAEAGAHLAGVTQSAFCRYPDQQRAETAGPLPLAFGPSADDDLLGPDVLHLQPRVAALARNVRSVPALGDDAFEAEPVRACQHVSAGRVPERVAGQQRPAGQAEGFEVLAALVVGQVKQRPPVEMQHVEDHIADRDLASAPGDLRTARQVQALLQAAEAGPPVRAERDKLAVQDGGTRPELLPRRAQLREGPGDVPVVPADGPGPAAADVDDCSYAIPLDLIGPAIVAGRQRPGDREHRPDPLRQRLEACPGRIHPVDHPVLAAGREQHVTAAGPRPVQHDLDLGIGPFLQLVLALVPDADLAAAVLALPDVAFEAPVLQRVILGMDGEVVSLRVLRHALRQGPRHQDAVSLEPEIPVQRPRVVLLHHERGRVLAVLFTRAISAHRFRSPGRITPRPVGTERIAVIRGGLPGTGAPRGNHLRPIPGSARPTPAPPTGQWQAEPAGDQTRAVSLRKRQTAPPAKMASQMMAFAAHASLTPTPRNGACTSWFRP